MVIGMGICTAAIGLTPSYASIGVTAPILLLLFRLLQGLFVGGEMGAAATLVVEHAPVGRRGLFGAILISGAGIANVASAGLMALLGAGSASFFMAWGWRIPFLLALVFAVIAVVLRSKLEEPEEFKVHTQAIALGRLKRTNPLKEALRHPEERHPRYSHRTAAEHRGLPRADLWTRFHGVQGHSGAGRFHRDHDRRRTADLRRAVLGLGLRQGRSPDFYIAAAIFFALLLYPAFALYSTDVAVLIWLGMVIGFVIPGVAMQSTLQTMLTEMFDVEARITGVNIGYQFSTCSAASRP